MVTEIYKGEDHMQEEIRSCAGGIVFYDGRVFLIREQTGVWAMPKGVIRDHNPSHETAKWRVEDEAGIIGNIIGIAGNTYYRLYSKSRDREVMNRIQWFAMTSETNAYRVNAEQGFLEGGWFTPDEAEKLLTRPMDAEVMREAEKIYLRQAQL